MNKKSKVVPLPVKVYRSDTFYDRLIQLFLQICSLKPTPQTNITGIFMEFGKFVWVQKGQSRLYNSGFFGKGDLSRSEPTWLKRTVEQNKNSLEEITVERRRKRRQKNNSNDALENLDILTSIELLDSTSKIDVENFQLDLYEAYFLVYALNALSIVNAADQVVILIGFHLIVMANVFFFFFCRCHYQLQIAGLFSVKAIQNFTRITLYITFIVV